MPTEIALGAFSFTTFDRARSVIGPASHDASRFSTWISSLAIIKRLDSMGRK